MVGTDKEKYGFLRNVARTNNLTIKQMVQILASHKPISMKLRTNTTDLFKQHKCTLK